MKKSFFSVLAALISVALISSGAHAATFKLKLTVVQTDGIVRIYDDEDQSAKGANKNCMSRPLLWNPDPWSIDSILVDPLVGAGTKIKILGSRGQTVGVGKITSAKFIKTDAYQDEDPEIGFVIEGYCSYSATITVDNSKFYEIKIGNLGSIDVSQAELKKKKWSYSLEVSN